ncbi:uncharacterized protein GIQ15_06204 [Arthroderma uncinatum]|uniref:uncharacterized protein n=1 Tax=Arthroderma uncinatum TaxID=74035 RepID=UPI00144A9B4E|nr:uncharacterized protein GIQ15_06204 [Arthroderma uncinatum]KAF3480857.1 hypothetical protein GIQ15_06204 [Arthroderma uncinatum]
MGQYFCLIAPHHRERLGWYGKLGEILFDGSASGLVSLFARPTLPLKNTSDKPKNIPVAIQGAVTPQKRRRQSESFCKSSRPHEPLRREVARSRLLELPAEVGYMIFDSLDITSVFLLGLTCQRLWAIAKTVIERHFAAYLGDWAGTPVVCVGNEIAPGKSFTYPQGLLLPEDVDELQEGFDVDELEGDAPDEYAGQPVNLFHLADIRYIDGPFIRVLGYGEVILWRTYCSSTAVEGNHQGAWAGHALDIVPSTYLDSGGPWKDVSDEVAEDIAKVWESAEGKDWRNQLIEQRGRNREVTGVAQTSNFGHRFYNVEAITYLLSMLDIDYSTTN